MADEKQATTSTFQDELSSIPLADEDNQAIISDDDTDVKPAAKLPTTMSEASTSNLESDSDLCIKQLDAVNLARQATLPHEPTSIESISYHGEYSDSVGPESLDPNDLSPDEAEEKDRLVQQVLELQNTLDDLSQRVDSVKEENFKLKSENQVLGQYIENLMSASSVFQSTSPKVSKKKAGGKK